VFSNEFVNNNQLNYTFNKSIPLVASVFSTKQLLIILLSEEATSLQGSEGLQPCGEWW